jgi:leucyl aminopeptidase
MSICGDLIDSADKDGTFLNRFVTGDEATISHLEIAITAKKEDTATGQVKGQGNA